MTKNDTIAFSHVSTWPKCPPSPACGGLHPHGRAVQGGEHAPSRTDCVTLLPGREGTSTTNSHVPSVQNEVASTTVDDRVYLDATCARGFLHPRCRGYRTVTDLGYVPSLPENDLFLFSELRSAAVDLRYGRAARYDRVETSKRIAARLDTLIEHGIRHVVLSAFGCGAFENPSDDVAAVYKEELQKRRSDFDVVAFGIFNAGYGPFKECPVIGRNHNGERIPLTIRWKIYHMKCAMLAVDSSGFRGLKLFAKYSKKESYV